MGKGIVSVTDGTTESFPWQVQFTGSGTGTTRVTESNGVATVYVGATGGTGGSGTMTTVKQAGTQVGDSDIVTLDFVSGFTLTESPNTEINISAIGGAESTTVSDTATVDLTLAGAEITADLIEAGAEAILDLQDLQGAVTDAQVPDNITIANAGSSTVAVNVADADYGDVAVSSGAWAVEDESHAHTTTTISNLDISADTNLAVTANQIVLTDDTLSLALNKDLVGTTPITINAGTGVDNILIGADGDVTVALTQLKDIVTTSPITGGENDVLPGADADLTIALTQLKDIVTTSPLTGGENDVLPGADADLTLAVTVQKDLVGTAPILINAGTGVDDLIIGSDADITISLAAAGIDGDDIASSIGGRSLTLTSASPDTLDVDAECYDYRSGVFIENPVDTDDWASIDHFEKAVTITKIWCESDQLVTLNLKRDDGSAADMATADLPCDPGGSCAASSGCITTLVDAEDNLSIGDEIDLDVASVGSTPTRVTVKWYGEIAD